MSDFVPASWQHRSSSERAALWLHGSSWVWRAARKRESPSKKAVLASCAAAKTGIFNMLLRLVPARELPERVEALPRVVLSASEPA